MHKRIGKKEKDDDDMMMMMTKTSRNNTDNDNQGDNCTRVIEDYQWLIEWSNSSSSS